MNVKATERTKAFTGSRGSGPAGGLNKYTKPATAAGFELPRKADQNSLT